MRARIILLERYETSLKVAFWAEVEDAKQMFYADNQKTSVVRNISADDLADLKAGKFVESVETFSFADQIDLVYLQNRWQEVQDALQAYNPWVVYRYSWDGEQWGNLP